MADAKAKKTRGRKPQQKRTYTHRPNAIHITVYSQDGRPVPKSVLNQAADSVTKVALENNLLIGLAES